MTLFKTEFGMMSLVMVGALNVGSMTLTFDSLVTNTEFLD